MFYIAFDSTYTQFRQYFLPKCWPNSTLTNTQTCPGKLEMAPTDDRKRLKEGCICCVGTCVNTSRSKGMLLSLCEWVYVWQLHSTLWLDAIFKLCLNIWMCQTWSESEPSVCSDCFSDNCQPVFTSLSIPAALTISAPSDFTSCFNELLSCNTQTKIYSYWKTSQLRRTDVQSK